MKTIKVLASLLALAATAEPALAQCTGIPPANVICASPNGAPGQPTFRTMVGADLPGNGAMGGSLTGTYPNPTIANSAVTNAMLAGSINLATKVTGTLPGTSMPALTGNVTLSAGSTSTTIANGVITDSMLAFGVFTNIQGLGTVTSGTLNGLTITGLADPSGNSDAANKHYVDAATTGVTFHPPVVVTTDGTALSGSPNYNNGTSGVGATLTATVNGKLTIDGHDVANGERVLVKDQADQTTNGVYTQLVLGTVSTTYQLVRATDMDSVGTGPGKMETNATFLTTSGTINTGANFALTTLPTIAIGSSNLVFSQNAASQVYTAGTGLTLSGSTFSLTSPVTVTLGGTGATTLSGLVQGNGTSALTAISNSSTTGQVLRVTGASTYAWGALNLASSSAVTGTLPLGNGGTGATSLTGLIQGNGASAMTSISGTSGGVPYFSGVGTLASSGTLATNGLLLGGGSGGSPTSMARLSTGQIAIGQASGAPIGAALTGDVMNAADGSTTISNGVVTNAKMSFMNAATLKGNPLNASTNVQDFTIQGLPGPLTPDANLDRILVYEHVSGTFMYATPGAISSSGVAGVSSIGGFTGSFTCGAGFICTSGNLATTWTTSGANIYNNNSGIVAIGGLTGAFGNLSVHVATDENFSLFGGVTAAAGISLQSHNDAVNALKPMEFRASEFLFMVGGLGVGEANTDAGTIDALTNYKVAGTVALTMPTNSAGPTDPQNNLGLGKGALSAISLPNCGTQWNLGIGYNALGAMTTSDHNVAVGAFSYSAITDGGGCPFVSGSKENTGIGVDSGRGCSSCQDTTMLGYHTGTQGAGGGTYTASYVTLVGAQAGLNLGSGVTLNTYVGYGAGQGSTSPIPVGANNTFIGANAGNGVAGSASNNTAGGSHAAALLTTGSYNTVFGYNACQRVTTGGGNLCLGSGAGLSTLVSGDDNILIGTINYPADTAAAGTLHSLNIAGLIYGDLNGKFVGIGTGSQSLSLPFQINAGLGGNMAGIDLVVGSNFSVTDALSLQACNLACNALRPIEIRGTDIYLQPNGGTRVTATSAGVTLNQTVAFDSYTTCQSGFVANSSGVLSCSGEAVSVASQGYGCASNASGGTALTNAYAVHKTVIVPVGCTLKVDADTTFAAGGELIVPCGATITVDSGKTLTVKSVMRDPGTCQIFTGTCSSGSWPGGTSCGRITGLRFNRPEWWGAVGDCDVSGSCSHDDKPALQAALDSAQGTSGASFNDSSAASDGDRPTVRLAGGKCYGINSTLTLLPTHFVPLRMQGAGVNDCSSSAGGSYIIPLSGASSIGVLVDGQTDGNAAIMNFELSDFSVTARTADVGNTNTCIQFGSSGKSINGFTRSVVRNVRAAGCVLQFSVPADTVLMRLILFDNIFADSGGGSSPSRAGFSVISGTGRVGEFEVINSNFASGNGAGSNVILSGTGGGTVTGIKFINVNFYAGNNSFWINTSGAGNVEDVFCNAGCQIDAGVGQNVGVKVDQNGTGHITNVNWSNGYIFGSAQRNVIVTGSSDWSLVKEISITNNVIGVTGASARAVDFNNGSNSNIANNRLDGVNADVGILVKDSIGINITGNTSTNSTYSAFFIDIQGNASTSYINACFNNASGAVSQVNVAHNATSPAGTAINAGSATPGSAACFNH